MKLKHRHRLRRKEVAHFRDILKESLGVDTFEETDPVDRASTLDYDVLIHKGQIMCLIFDEVPFLSIRGILNYGAESSFVTVDMGAVPYVINGADIMSPGIVDLDKTLKEGDIAWVRDITHSKPLAIVRLSKSPDEILNEKKGKAALNIHYVGDKLWTILD